LPHETKKKRSKIFSGKLLWFGKNIAKSCSRTPTRLNCPLKHLNAGHTSVAERDGQILGFCVVLPRPDGDADLDGLFVEPAIWRRGAGRRLVQEAERVAASRGAQWLYVIGNPKAQGFYQVCNFERVGIEQTRFGPGLAMRKRLSAKSPKA